MKVAKELSECKLDLVGVQEVRWDRGGTDPAGEYTFFYGKEMRSRIDTGFFVRKRIMSAVKSLLMIGRRSETTRKTKT
jgi:hypothetical protein